MATFTQTKVNGVDKLVWTWSGLIATFEGTIIGNSIIGTIVIVGIDKISRNFDISGNVIRLDTSSNNIGATFVDIRTTKPTDDVNMWSHNTDLGVYTRTLEFGKGGYSHDGPYLRDGAIRFGKDIDTKFIGYCWDYSVVNIGSMSNQTRLMTIEDGIQFKSDQKLIGKWRNVGSRRIFVGLIEWSDKKFDGLFDEYSGYADGVLTKSTGAKFVGKLVNWQPIKGITSLPTGEEVDGTYVDGILIKGKCVKTNGIYEGTFKNDEIINGTYVGLDGTKYEGSLQNWYATGKGKLTTTNGTVHAGIFDSNMLVDGSIKSNDFIATGKFGTSIFPTGIFSIDGTFEWLTGPHVGKKYIGNISSGRGVKIDYGNGITAIGDIVDVDGTRTWTLNGQAKMEFGIQIPITNELIEMSKNDAIPMSIINPENELLPARYIGICLDWGEDRNKSTHCCGVVFDGIYVDDVPKSGKMTFCDESTQKWEYVGAVNAKYLPHGIGIMRQLTDEDDEPIEADKERLFDGLFENGRLIEGKIRFYGNTTIEGNFRENGSIFFIRNGYGNCNFVGTVEGIGKFTYTKKRWSIIDTFSNYFPVYKKYDVSFPIGHQIKITIAGTECVMGKNSPIRFCGYVVNGIGPIELYNGTYEDDCYIFNTMDDNEDKLLLRADTENWECRGSFVWNNFNSYIFQSGIYRTPDLMMEGQFVEQPPSSGSCFGPPSPLKPSLVTVSYRNGDVYTGPLDGSHGTYRFANGLSHTGVCPNRKAPPALMAMISAVSTLVVSTPIGPTMGTVVAGTCVAGTGTMSADNDKKDPELPPPEMGI